LNNLFAGNGDDGLSEDTASTLVLVELVDGGDVDVAIETPVSTPGVLDDEGFQDTDLLVTDSEDGVVEVSTATSGDNTLSVELEDILVSFNSDGDGSVD